MNVYTYRVAYVEMYSAFAEIRVSSAFFCRLIYGLKFRRTI